MKHIITLLLLLCPFTLRAQTATDQIIDSIMNYLADNSHEGFVVKERNGRNHATRGEFTVGKGETAAPASMVRGIRWWLDRLPYLRWMTDERAGEQMEGRIAMRLQPEDGDTSAYFLLTYDPTKLTFKYGVNSPGSISLAKTSAKTPGVGFHHHELTQAEASPVISMFDAYSRRSDARVIDTLFQYDGDKDYEWCTGRRRPTQACLVLMPSPTERDIQEWANMFWRYDDSDKVTIALRNSCKDKHTFLVSANGAFTVNDIFHLFVAVHYRSYLCLVRVVAANDDPCEIIPDFARLMDSLIDGDRHTAGVLATIE